VESHLSQAESTTTPAGSRGIRSSLLDFRDRMISSPKFQRWAARTPIVRSLARSRARSLFDLTAGFVYSQVLYACVQLRLFELLAGGAKTVEELGVYMRIPEDGISRLLLAAESLGLVQRRSDHLFGLGELGAAVVANPSIERMVCHHQRLYADLADPVSLLKGRRETHLGAFWPYAGATGEIAPELTTEYSNLMADSLALIVDDIFDAYPICRHQHLLDVGGGVGMFASEALRRCSDIHATVFDLPEVVKRAEINLAELGYGHRSSVHGGNAFEDPLPKGPDLISLVRVLHDHHDHEVMTMLRSAREILPAQGALMIAEPMANTAGAEPVGEAYFGFYLLAMGKGKPRTAERLKDMVNAAGFSQCREIKTNRPILVRMLVATP